MGRDTEFAYGHNTDKKEKASTQKTAAPLNDWTRTGCTEPISCFTCGKKYGVCHELERELNPTQENNEMDLGKYKSGKKAGDKYARLPWLDGDCIPEKGASITIDAIREPRKKGSKVVVFLDVTVGKKKFTWSIRKGFTLDALMEELGTNTDKWTKKKIRVVRGGDDGQYVNVA